MKIKFPFIPSDSFKMKNKSFKPLKGRALYFIYFYVCYTRSTSVTENSALLTRDFIGVLEILKIRPVMSRICALRVPCCYTKSKTIRITFLSNRNPSFVVGYVVRPRKL